MDTITPAVGWAERYTLTLTADRAPDISSVVHLLLEHRRRTGTSWIPTTARDQAGRRVGAWAGYARARMRLGTLSPSERASLIGAGLVTSDALQSFIDTTDHLAEHRDRHGRSAPLPGPDAISADGFPLGEALRRLTGQNIDDRARLDHLVARLGHHYLNTHPVTRHLPHGLTMPNLFGLILAQYGDRATFRRAYTRFVHLHGTPEVPYDHVCADGLPLGSWFEVLAATPQRATLPGQERLFVEQASPHVTWAIRSTRQARTISRMLVRLELRAGLGDDLRLLDTQHADSIEARWMSDVFPRIHVSADEARRFRSLGLRNRHMRRATTLKASTAA